MKKCVWLIALALVSVGQMAAHVPAGMAASSGVEIDGVYYILSETNHTATVTWGGSYETAGTAAYVGDMVIPASVSYEGVTYDVTLLGYRAFCNCTELTSIVLPSSATKMSDDVFKGCTKLSSVTLAEGLEVLASYTFCGCTSLSAIELPKSLTTILSNVFDGCTGLSSVDLPEGLTTLGNSAFKGCTGLTSMVLPSTVTSVSDYAFDGCTGLTEVRIYSDVLTTVGSYAWSKTIPTYVPAKSITTYKGNLLRAYNVKILPDDDHIGEVVQSLLNLSNDEVAVFNELLKARSTMGRKQDGPAIEVTDQNGKVIRLYNPKKVEFMRITGE